MLTKRRRSLIGLIVLFLVLMGFSAQQLLRSEIHLWEARFTQHAQNIANAVSNQLDTNEAVLAGFSAFLQAVGQSDAEAANHYAAAVISAYPGVFMLAAARGVARAEENAFAEQLRRTWRADFQLKDFPSLANQRSERMPPTHESWPVLFMYPPLPQTGAVYGVRLETVGALAATLAQVHRRSTPVASPVFSLHEGGSAYVLMQSVYRSPQLPQKGRPNLFGGSMVALLLVKSDSLLEAVASVAPDPQVAIEALPGDDATSPYRLFSRQAAPAGMLDRLLPRLSTQVELRSRTQPTLLLFERQLRLGDVCTLETIVLLLVLVGTLVLLPVLLVRHFRTIEKVEHEHEHSAYLATHDVLTELANRNLLAARFGEAYAYWQRHGVSFAVMVVDLDHFKTINDRFGHEIGDQVLRTVAMRMQGATRPYDTVARYGGDEFVVLVRDIGRAEHARAVGASILEAIGKPIATTAGEQSVSCSIGVALCPTHGETFDLLLTAADQAMYRVKQRGRHGIAVCGDDD